MAICDKCGVFDDQELENNPELTEESPKYEPDTSYLWHGDIQEEYDMGEYTCLCDSCFVKLTEGKIIKRKMIYYTLNVFDCSTAEMTANIMNDFQKLGLPDNVEVEVVYQSPTKEDLDDPIFHSTPPMRETKMGQRLIKEHLT